MNGIDDDDNNFVDVVKVSKRVVFMSCFDVFVLIIENCL